MIKPTEPQQDQNVEGVKFIAQPYINALCPAHWEVWHVLWEGPGSTRSTVFFGHESEARAKEYAEWKNSRPSQPPQNVEARDAVKGVVEEIEVLRKEHSRIAQENNVHPFTGTRHRMSMVNLLFSDRLRLALSATGDDVRGGELARKVEEFKKRWGNQRLITYATIEVANEIVAFFFDHAPAIIAASTNAERLKKCREHLGKLIAAMVHWGKQEDGVPTDCWVAFKAAEDFFLATLPPSILPPFSPAPAQPPLCDCPICHGEGFVGSDGTTCDCIRFGCRKRHKRDEYLPKAPAQTPGDERQG